MSPEVIYDITSNREVHINYNIRNPHDAHTTYMASSIFILAGNLWTLLSHIIQNMPTFGTYKKLLKKKIALKP